MKTKALLIVTFFLGILSCEKKESNEIDQHIYAVWELETTPTNFETVEFKSDMTYTITAKHNMPIAFGVFNNTTIEITGNWTFDNNTITFTTSHAALNSNSSESELSTQEEQPISDFHGYEEGSIYEGTPGMNRTEGQEIFMNSHFAPTTWIIEDLNDTSLTVTRGPETSKYKKQ